MEKWFLPVLNANKNSMWMLRVCVCASDVLTGRHKGKNFSWKQESARCKKSVCTRTAHTHTGHSVFGLFSEEREQLVRCVCVTLGFWACKQQQRWLTNQRWSDGNQSVRLNVKLTSPEHDKSWRFDTEQVCEPCTLPLITEVWAENIIFKVMMSLFESSHCWFWLQHISIEISMLKMKNGHGY